MVRDKKEKAGKADNGSAEIYMVTGLGNRFATPTPIAITGTSIVSSLILCLLLPIPAPGEIPVSVI